MKHVFQCEGSLTRFQRVEMYSVLCAIPSKESTFAFCRTSVANAAQKTALEMMFL